MINEDDIIAYDLPLLQQRIKAEAAAQGRELKDLSDEELNKRAEEMGGDASNYQSAYTLGRRADGTPGFDINKPKQKTLAQLVRGNQEPPPAFFAGIPEAMQQAIAGINRERVAEGVSTGIEDTAPSFPIPTETGRGATVPPATLSGINQQRRGLVNKDLRSLEVGSEQDQVSKQLQALRAQQGSLAVGEAMMESPPTSGRGRTGDNRGVLGDVRQAMQNQGNLDVLKMDSASKAFDRLNVEERKVDEQKQRTADVATQDAQAIGRQNSPEERAEVLNKQAVTKYDSEFPNTPIEQNLEEFKRIQGQVYSDAYEQIFQKQGLSEEEVGLVVDPNTGLFTAVPEPETAYEANPERLKYIQENINDSNSLDLANFLIRLEENDELGRSQRNAVKRLTAEIVRREQMESPLTKETFLELERDTRFKGAFNAIKRLEDDDPEILENIFNAMEVAGAIPMLAPVGRSALLARSGVQGVRNLLGLAAKSRSSGTGAFKATAQRSAQATGPGSGGVVFTSQQGGKTTATIQVVKTRPKVVTNVPKGTKAGLRRVGDKFAEQPRKGTRGNLRAENAPAPLGGNRKAVLFAIPYDNSSEEEIEASTEFQNNALNYIISLEDFSNKPYKDGEATSIGYGTRAEEGQQSITREDAAQKAQEYLEKEVYPEIDFIQENGSRSLNKRQIIALSSLIYNIGSPAWRKSKAREALLAGDMGTFKEEAFSGPNAFLTRDPSFLAGLRNRREKELALFEDVGPTVPVG